MSGGYENSKKVRRGNTGKYKALKHLAGVEILSKQRDIKQAKRRTTKRLQKNKSRNIK